MSAHWVKLFSVFRRRAHKAVRNRSAVARTVGDAYKKAYQHRGGLAATWDDLQAAMRLARCWAAGEYRNVSRVALATVVGALAYFVCPMDAIVDVVPVLGLLDDAAVIGFAVRGIRAELNAFRQWEAGREVPALEGAVTAAT